MNVRTMLPSYRGTHENSSLRSPWCCILLTGLCAVAGPAWAQPLGDERPPDLWTRKSGSDWPDFLGPARNGKSPEVNVLAPWPAQGPPIVWQAALGTSYGAPSLSRGRLFHFDRHDDQARLTCRAAETGRELWRCEHPTDYQDMLNYNNGPRCTPVVDGSRVYTFSADGMLQCVRTADGTPVWRIDTMQRFGVAQNFFGVGSTPVLFQDVLIANIGGSPPGSPADVYSGPVEGNGTGIVAFDKHTGEVRWSATDELASYASPVLASIGDRPWCFVFARGGLIGCDPRDGSVDFSFPWRADLLESVNASSPVVVGSDVFISETYGPGSACCECGRAACTKCGQIATSGVTNRWPSTGTHPSITTGSCMRRAVATEDRRSCAASSGRPGGSGGGKGGWREHPCCTSTVIWFVLAKTARCA